MPRFLIVWFIALNWIVSLAGATSSLPDVFSKTGADISTAISWSFPNDSFSIDYSLRNSVPVASIQVELAAPASHKTTFVAECNMPTEQGKFKMRAYEYLSSTQRLDPIVMISGDVFGKENVLVRVHDQCLTSEVFGSKPCDCKQQLKRSLGQIQHEADGGVVIYLQQEGRGIGIANKIAAYALQDQGLDTVDANLQLGFHEELREYKCIPDILRDLGIRSIRLLTNNPFKMQQLTALGVNITERVSIQVPSNPHSEKYLRVKKDRMSHFLTEEVVTNRPIEHRATRPHMRGGALGTSIRGKSSNAATTAQQPVRPRGLAGGSESVTGDLAYCTEPTCNTVPPNHAIHHTDTHTSQNASYALGKDSVLAAIAAIQAGQTVVVVDDADRENEGDLIVAAAHATAENIGFIVRYSSGVLCVSLEGSRLDALKLPPMVTNNQDPKQTAYSVSVDYKHGTSTGISAADHALTFRKLVDVHAAPEEFQRPGHVFPLRYKPGGVLARAGHTEASLDLTRLAKLPAGGVLAEIVHDDGSMMRFPNLVKFAAKYGLVLTSVQDIVAYRLEVEK